MKRTNKHVKEGTKPAQQAAFKTPAQELEEFKAKVLAMRYGEFIWLNLDACPVRDIGSFTGPQEFPAAFCEAKRKLPELWPEYMRLLKLNPDELKAYQYRAAWNGTGWWRFANRRPPKDVIRDLAQKVLARDTFTAMWIAAGYSSQGPGRPRDPMLAERDAQIVYMKDVQGYSFGQIGQMMGIGRTVASSAYYRIKGDIPKGKATGKVKLNSR